MLGPSLPIPISCSLPSWKLPHLISFPQQFQALIPVAWMGQELKELVCVLSLLI